MRADLIPERATSHASKKALLSGCSQLAAQQRSCFSFRLPAGRKLSDDPLPSAMAWAGTPTAMNSFGIFPKISKPVAIGFSRSLNQIWLAISSSFAFRWRAAIKLQAKSLSYLSKVSLFTEIKTNPILYYISGSCKWMVKLRVLQNKLSFC